MRRGAPGLVARRFCQLLQGMQRCRALGLQQRLMHRLHRPQAMHLKSAHFQNRHLGERAHLLAVATQGTPAAAARAEASLCPASRPASTSDVAMRFRSHSKGPRIVSSKSLMSKTSRPSCAANAPRLRTCASPQSCDHNTGVGHQGQIGRHHRRCAAKVDKRRLCHQLMFQLDQRRQAPAFRPFQQRQGRCRSRFDVEFVMLLASHLFASRLAKLATFFRRCPLHVRDHIPSLHGVANRCHTARIRPVNSPRSIAPGQDSGRESVI